MSKSVFRFLTRSGTNWTVQPHKMIRSLKVWNQEEKELYYLCSKFAKNKGADQLFGHREADLHLCFRIYAKSRFSHDVAKLK